MSGEISTYIAFRFAIKLIWAGLLLIFGNAYVIYWIFHELSLEASFREKYGPTWKVEFERYHGSLSHAHSQMAIAVFGLLAIAVVLIWLLWQEFHKPKNQ
jgi:hypothetical protein